MDRRGFGASGDAAGYSIEREFEDVAVVVDAARLAPVPRLPVGPFLHGAGMRHGRRRPTTNVHRLVLYEPSLGLAYPAGSIESIERKVASGDMEAALLEVLVEIGGMTDDEVAADAIEPQDVVGRPARDRPDRAEGVQGRGRLGLRRPGQFDGIAAPTLMLAGSESPPALNEATHLAAAAIPDVRSECSRGHGHVAHRTDPAMVAAIIRRFIAR